MAAVKETPRQRMIGLMYLVLLALLALNVSRETLDAFALINESVVQTVKVTTQNLQDVYKNFEVSYQFNQMKVKPFWEKAKEAKRLSKEMITYIENTRNELISLTEGLPIDIAREIKINDCSKKDNNTIPTNYFFGNSMDGSKGKARELKEKLKVFHKNIVKLIDPYMADKLNLGWSTNEPYYNADGLKENWEMHFFYNTILAADITLLNKLILDVRVAEFDVVNLVYKSIGQGDFKFDKVEAKVLPKSEFVYAGDDYTAQIIVAAFDTSQSPEVYYLNGVDSLPVNKIESANLIRVKPNDVTVRFNTSGEGQRKFAGLVRIKSAMNITNNYHFKGEYVVVNPSFSISPTNMNVLYSGVDNPVSIAVSGVIKESLVPVISCGTIKPKLKGNGWIVNVSPECSEATISISAVVNGQRKQMGLQSFRVKKLPDPKATISNKNNGAINRDIMIAAGKIEAKMPDDFEFAYSFSIKSFTMTIQRGINISNYKSGNAHLTEEMIQQLKRTNKGQKIVFDNIIAEDPLGDKRFLSPIVFNIE